ncbi:hypothetical protein HYT05_04695 [Candidatus Kaiserbacteria bacterium]|nr:hypothetical protein [Candidatus Kaiserbacteria bacterium]
MDPKTNFEEVMAERFKRLPPSVQSAITSADVEAHLRELAKTQQLHLDQWDLLENEVMLTLLGLAKTSELKQNIMKEVGVSDEVATVLARDIAEYVFKPIRDELERQLEHPEAQEAKVSDMDAMRTQVLSGQKSTGTSQAAIPPTTAPTIPTPSTDSTSSLKSSSGQASTTPPAAAPLSEKPAPTSGSATYSSQAPSHERKTIEGDPYREQIV